MTQTAPEQSNPQQPSRPAPVATGHAARAITGIGQAFRVYFWFILKNVIGWMFMLASLPVGIAVPGPGGLPLFILGFALVAFPGKRRLTSHVIRGRPIHVEPMFFTFLVTVISILITVGLLWFVQTKYDELLDKLHLRISLVQLLGVCALAAAVTWFVMKLGLAVLNFILRRMPLIRRKLRPWLRKKGVNLLPRGDDAD